MSFKKLILRPSTETYFNPKTIEDPLAWSIEWKKALHPLSAPKIETPTPDVLIFQTVVHIYKPYLVGFALFLNALLLLTLTNCTKRCELIMTYKNQYSLNSRDTRLDPISTHKFTK